MRISLETDLDTNWLHHHHRLTLNSREIPTGRCLHHHFTHRIGENERKVDRECLYRGGGKRNLLLTVRITHGAPYNCTNAHGFTHPDWTDADNTNSTAHVSLLYPSMSRAN